MVTYWLDLFTGTTWKEFRESGAKISGFRERRRKTVNRIAPGDILLCYMTGVMRWVGALEVIGPSDNQEKIWTGQTDNEELEFPARLQVTSLVMLEPEYGVPMEELEGHVAFYKDVSDRGGFKGFLRGSPTKFSDEDGKFVHSLIEEAKGNPIFREVDSAKINRLPTYRIKEGDKAVTVTVPDNDEEEQETDNAPDVIPDSNDQPSLHTKIQYHLLRLGAEMGLKVWVARNDRSKQYNGQFLGQMPRMVNALPTQFNDATQKTIELIDVLWLKGNSIVAAFEVEATTSIYSGLLRMSDLLSLQPNLQIKLYLVAPDDKYEKVKREILRPTFEKREKPLSRVCGYLSFSELIDKIRAIHDLGIAPSLHPDFLESMAEFFDLEDNT